MWRYLVGLVAGVLLVAGGVLWWRNTAGAEKAVVSPPVVAQSDASVDEDLPEPPRASEKTREERRFSRYDRDKNGAVSREEYVASRRKAFAKLDKDGDGKLSFEEYAVKTIDKFGKADGDRSGILTPTEFATTRVVRKSRPSTRCAPPATAEDS